MANQRLVTQIKRKNLFTSYSIITKSEENQALFINQCRSNTLEFLSSLIDQILVQFNDTYVRNLSEPEKELYKICADKWNALFNLVTNHVRIPYDGKVKSKTIFNWLSPIRGVAFAVKNDECFLARRSDTRCDSNRHTAGLVMCRHYFTCGFVSRCIDKMAEHRCTADITFHRHHIDPEHNSEYKSAFVRKIVRDAVKLKPFRNSRLNIFPDQRRRHQIAPPQIVHAPARQNHPIIEVDLDNEEEDDDIEEIFPDMHRK